MKINTYLQYDGKCTEAFKFYEKVLGAKIMIMMTYGEGPMAAQCKPEEQKYVMHGRIAIGDTVLMASDSPHGRYEKPQGYSVTISVDEPKDADRLFTALSEGGHIIMNIEETFWARRFGMLVDKFGIPWMVNCEKPM